MRIPLLIFLTLGLFTARASSTAYRNHPDVLYRPVICAAILGEFAHQSMQREDYGQVLESLTFSIYKRIEVTLTKEEAASQYASLKGRFQYNRRNPGESRSLAAAGFQINSMYEDTRNLVDGKIVWVSAVTGKEEILRRLKARQQTLDQLQSRIVPLVRKAMPDYRFANLTAPALTASFGFYGLASAIYGALGDVSVMSAVGPALAFYLAKEGVPSSVHALQQMGLAPIERHERTSTFDIRFRNHNRDMEAALADFRPTDLLLFSDHTMMGSGQFDAMKACKLESGIIDDQHIANSCFYSRINNLDLIIPSRELEKFYAEEEAAAKADRRWSTPQTLFDDLLGADPWTGEPVLVTTMRFIANKTPAPSKPKRKPKAEEKMIFTPGGLAPLAN